MTKFRFPYEHGAWAIFLLSLSGGTLLAWRAGARGMVYAVAAACLVLFLLNEWLRDLLAPRLGATAHRWLRPKLKDRSLPLMATAAALMALPAMLLAGLSGGWAAGLRDGAWPLVFFPASSLLVQDVVRGRGLGYAAALAQLGLAILALCLGAWAGGILLLAHLGRLGWLAKPKHPLQGAAIRRLGWETAAWSVGLGIVWVFSLWGS